MSNPVSPFGHDVMDATVKHERGYEYVVCPSCKSHFEISEDFKREVEVNCENWGCSGYDVEFVCDSWPCSSKFTAAVLVRGKYSPQFQEEP